MQFELNGDFFFLCVFFECITASCVDCVLCTQCTVTYLLSDTQMTHSTFNGLVSINLLHSYHENMEHLWWPASHFILVFQGFVYGSLVIKFSDDLWAPSVHESDCSQGWKLRVPKPFEQKSRKFLVISFTMTLIVFYSFRCSLLNLNEWFISVRIRNNWKTQQSIRWKL